MAACASRWGWFTPMKMGTIRWNTFPIVSHIVREIRDRAKLRHRGAKSGQGWEGMHPLWPRGIRVRRQVMHRLLRENRDAILRIARKHGVDSIRVFGSRAPGG